VPLVRDPGEKQGENRVVNRMNMANGREKKVHENHSERERRCIRTKYIKNGKRSRWGDAGSIEKEESGPANAGDRKTR